MTSRPVAGDSSVQACDLAKPVVDGGDYAVGSGRAWYALLLLTAAFTFSLLDRTVLSLLIVPIQADLGISDTEFGLLLGPAFSVFYLLAGLPLGWLIDRRSRKHILSAGIALWSLMTVLSGLASSFLHLLVARVGVAVGEATLSPAAYSMLADMFPRSKLGRALAVYSAGSSLGMGLAFLLGGSLLTILGNRPDLYLPVIGLVRSWQFTFIAIGLPGVILALLILTIREPRRPSAPPQPTTAGLRELGRFVSSNRRVFFLHFGAFCCTTLVMYGFLSWGAALLLRKHDFDPGMTGVAMAVAAGAMGFVGLFGGGALADYWLRLGRLDAHMRVGMFAMIAALPAAMVTTLSSNAAISIVGLCVLFALLFAPTPAGVAGLQLMTPPRLRGQVSAIFVLVVNFVGLGLGPLLVGLMNDFGFASRDAVDQSLAVLTILFLPLAIAAFAFVRRPFGERVEASKAGFGTKSPSP